MRFNASRKRAGLDLSCQRERGIFFDAAHMFPTLTASTVPQILRRSMCKL